MDRKTKVFTWVVLLGALYHFVRDILQIVGVDHFWTRVGHWEHAWCGPYCDYVTLPLDIYLVIVPILILRRNRFGALGGSVFVALLIGLGMWLAR